MRNALKLTWMVIITACVLLSSGIVQAIIPQAVPAANKTGNSTKFQLGSGTPTAGNCATFDTNLNIVSSGSTTCTGTLVLPPTGTAGPVAIPAATLIAVTTASLGAGTIDIFTSPANTRSYISNQVDMVNRTGGASTCQPFLKHDAGTLTALGSSQSSNNNDNVSCNIPQFVLEPGESISVTFGNAGFSAFLNIIEYPSSFGFFTARLYTVASGNNTLFTAVSPSVVVKDGCCGFKLFNSDASSITWQVNRVPSGGSPATGNLVQGPFTANTNTGSAAGGSMTLNTGDFFNFNASAARSTFVWVTVMSQ